MNVHIWGEYAVWKTSSSKPHPKIQVTRELYGTLTVTTLVSVLRQVVLGKTTKNRCSPVANVELAAIARGIGTLKPPQMHHLNWYLLYFAFASTYINCCRYL